MCLLVRCSEEALLVPKITHVSRYCDDLCCALCNALFALIHSVCVGVECTWCGGIRCGVYLVWSVLDVNVVC